MIIRLYEITIYVMSIPTSHPRDDVQSKKNTNRRNCHRAYPKSRTYMKYLFHFKARNGIIECAVTFQIHFHPSFTPLFDFWTNAVRIFIVIDKIHSNFRGQFISSFSCHYFSIDAKMIKVSNYKLIFLVPMIRSMNFSSVPYLDSCAEKSILKWRSLRYYFRSPILQ